MALSNRFLWHHFIPSREQLPQELLTLARILAVKPSDRYREFPAVPHLITGRLPSDSGTQSLQLTAWEIPNGHLICRSDSEVFEIRNTEDLTEEWLREKLGYFH
ncbi:UNVERIFIED_CONTAM: hypothetical protein K2H54_012707 [Gekko kuhli]